MCYHNVNYSKRINPENFEKNLIALKSNGFKPIRLQEIYDYIARSENPPKKSVHITFDDGYADNFIYAYPLLKKYGFFATIFLVVNKVVNGMKRATYEELLSLNMTNKIDEFLKKSRYVSWDEVREMSNSGIFEIGSHSLNHSACFSSKTPRKFSNSAVYEWFYELTNDKRLGVPIYEKKWNCAVNCVKDDVNLRNHMASFVSKKGGIIFFKNHSAQRILLKEYNKYLKTHTVNFEVENENIRMKRAKLEIEDSKKIIQDKIGKDVDFFCYPWGDYDKISVETVKQAGYKGALTLNIGLNGKKTDPFLMNRVEVRSGKWLEKRLKIYKSRSLSFIYSKVYRKI